VTSFNIGTPPATRYYFITAYDATNNEFASSNVATFTSPVLTPPVTSPTPLTAPPPPGSLRISPVQ